MAKITELIQTERKIRKTLLTPGGNEINIFEPNANEAFDLIDIFENIDFKIITEVEMIKKVYPILTDLDFSDCTDDMIQQVVDTGTLQVLEINEEIMSIFAELNLIKLTREKTQTLHARAMLMEADTIKTAIETLNDSDKLMSQAIDLEREARLKNKKEKAEKRYAARKQKQHQETSNEKN